jgi:hypothetical protein
LCSTPKVIGLKRICNTTYRTIQALPLILGKEHDQDAKYLDTCRNKRNIVEYDYVGGFSNFQPNG